MLPELLNRCFLALVRLDLRASRGAQNGPAAANDSADLAGTQPRELPGNQPRITVADPEHLDTVGCSGSYDSTDGGVHTGRIPAARHYSKSLHRYCPGNHNRGMVHLFGYRGDPRMYVYVIRGCTYWRLFLPE